MGDKTKIEWTDATWNPIRFRNNKTGGNGHYCEVVSKGCANCYSQRMQVRFKNPIKFNSRALEDGEVYLDEKVLRQPLAWDRPRMIFVCSMTDLFGDWVKPEWIAAIVDVMDRTKRHIYQALTKRPENIWRKWVSPECRERICKAAALTGIICPHDSCDVDDRVRPAGLPNLWLGTTVENSDSLHRIDTLKACGRLAKYLFVSAEPLLGPLPTLGEHLDGIAQVITGGESGPNARPSHPDWFRSIRDQCLAHGVAFFHKQHGEWVTPEQYGGSGVDVYAKTVCMDISGRIYGKKELLPHGQGVSLFYRMGKKAAGRLLDGQEWSEFPNVSKS